MTVAEIEENMTDQEYQYWGLYYDAKKALQEQQG